MIIIGKKGCYLKSIDLEKGILYFTDKKTASLTYRDTWKPGVELDMLKHNFSEKYPEELRDMHVMEVTSNDDDTSHDHVINMHPHGAGMVAMDMPAMDDGEDAMAPDPDWIGGITDDDLIG